MEGTWLRQNSLWTEIWKQRQAEAGIRPSAVDFANKAWKATRRREINPIRPSNLASVKRVREHPPTHPVPTHTETPNKGRAMVPGMQKVPPSLKASRVEGNVKIHHMMRERERESPERPGSDSAPLILMDPQWSQGWSTWAVCIQTACGIAWPSRRWMEGVREAVSSKVFWSILKRV